MALTRPMLRRDGERLRLHYDPAIGVPLRGDHAELAAAPARPRSGPPTTRSAARRWCCAAPSPTSSRRRRRRRWRARGPKARVHEFAGVGHAPTIVAADQVAVVREFLQDGA